MIDACNVVESAACLTLFLVARLPPRSAGSTSAVFCSHMALMHTTRTYLLMLSSPPADCGFTLCRELDALGHLIQDSGGYLYSCSSLVA